jgi:hypothetical protein
MHGWVAPVNDDDPEMIRCNLSVWPIFLILLVFLLAVLSFVSAVYNAMDRALLDAIKGGGIGMLLTICSIGHFPYIYSWVETDGSRLRFKRFLSGHIIDRRLDEIVNVRNIAFKGFRRASRNLRAFVPGFEVRFSDGCSIELLRYWLPGLDPILDVLEPYRDTGQPNPGAERPDSD